MLDHSTHKRRMSIALPSNHFHRAVLALAATLLLGFTLGGCTPAPAPTTTPQPPTAMPLSTIQEFDGLSADHISGPITYEQTPPAGGPHSQIWQNCGIYDQPVPNEQAVHSLEHGAVWITYQPSLAEADVMQLRDAVRGKSHVLLSPYPDLPAPVVASAWGLQLQLDGAADARLIDFITQYENGPQTPEPGAPCTGGVGDPIADS